MYLRDRCKSRILEDMVGPTTKPQGYIAMIVDEKTLRILSSCCKVYDVLEKGVSVVELLGKKRQPLTNLDALYFISPDEKSIRLLLEDFPSASKQLYKNAHLFFSSPLHNTMMQTIAQSKSLSKNIKSFFDFNLNFIAYEQRVFHFDSPNLLTQLYPSISDAMIQALSEKLLTVCCTINERPNVRFQSSNLRIAEKVASNVNDMLKEHPVLGNKNGSSTLLIVERSVDLATLMLHEYTYQAFAYDELDIPCCVDKTKLVDGAAANEDIYTYDVTNASGLKETKQAILGEHDEMWVRFRHEHLQLVNQKIGEEAKKFAKENPAALFQRQENITAGDAAKAVRALPEYQELLSKYWTHVSLGEDCIKQLQATNIIKVGYAEQDICCCVDKDGKEMNATKLLQSLTTVLSDPSIKSELKVRLLFLYFTQMNGITEADRRKMFEAAELSLEYQRCILALLNLGLHTADRCEASESSGKHVHILQSNRERIKYLKQKARSAQFDLSRFEPVVKQLMVNFYTGSLSKGLYPYVKEPVNFVEEKPAAREWNGISPTAKQWEWSTSTGVVEANEQKDSKKKLVIFVIGDITFAEMRCAYEASKAGEYDVYIGGTAITTPKRLIESLKGFEINGKGK